MTKLFKCAAFCGMILVGTGMQTARAADVSANIFLTVNVALTGVKQTELGVEKVRLSTLDIISAVAHETTNIFSPKAKLLLRIPVGLGSGPTFLVRDSVNKTNIVDFEIPSTMLWMIQIGDSVNATRPGSAGFVAETQISVSEFTLQTSQLSFDVQGYTSTALDNRGNLGQKLADTCPATASSKVVGTGSDSDGNSTVLQGTITVNGRKIVNAN